MKICTSRVSMKSSWRDRRGLITICPAFFKRYRPLLPPGNCTLVNRFVNNFIGGRLPQVAYQARVLLEEIAHLYIYAKGDGMSDIGPVNKYVGLSTEMSVKDARNYLCYIFSELYPDDVYCWLTIISGIYGNRTTFPSISRMSHDEII